MDKQNEKVLTDDQQLTHAVECVDAVFDSGREISPHTMARNIARALKLIDQRALAGGMVVLNSVVTQTSFFDGKNGRVCTTIICQWASREALERMQLQQSLSPNGGPRRA